eukprot:7983093-Pyramimonas_sp.AAC.1
MPFLASPFLAFLAPPCRSRAFGGRRAVCQIACDDERGAFAKLFEPEPPSPGDARSAGAGRRASAAGAAQPRPDQ